MKHKIVGCFARAKSREQDMKNVQAIELDQGARRMCAKHKGNPFFDVFLARQFRAFPGNGNRNRRNWMICHWPHSDASLSGEQRSKFSGPIAEPEEGE